MERFEVNRGGLCWTYIIDRYVGRAVGTTIWRAVSPVFLNQNAVSYIYGAFVHGYPEVSMRWYSYYLKREMYYNNNNQQRSLTACSAKGSSIGMIS